MPAFIIFVEQPAKVMRMVIDHYGDSQRFAALIIGDMVDLNAGAGAPALLCCGFFGAGGGVVELGSHGTCLCDTMKLSRLQCLGCGRLNLHAFMRIFTQFLFVDS